MELELDLKSFSKVESMVINKDKPQSLLNPLRFKIYNC